MRRKTYREERERERQSDGESKGKRGGEGELYYYEIQKDRRNENYYQEHISC